MRMAGRDLAYSHIIHMLIVRSQQVHPLHARQLILISRNPSTRAVCLRVVIGCICLFSFGDRWPWPETKAPEGKLELVLWHLKRLVFIIPKITIAFLPKRIHAWTWFTVRFIFKLQVAFKGKFSWKKKRQSLRVGPEKSSSAHDEKLHPLARLLYWDILLLVARDLHYSDVISLSLASKQMRETILLRTDRQARLGLLKKYTLDAEYTRQCDVCGAPVCDVSSLLPLASAAISRVSTETYKLK